MTEDWLSRWREGRIGWHEAGGNAALRRHWPSIPPGRQVLVPLCGKSVDMVWLAERGLAVTGVELSATAVEAFFAEQRLTASVERRAPFDVYTASEIPVALWCGDFFDFTETGFDALYDRGALVALPPDLRPRYAERLKRLLRPGADRLILTLEYDQARVPGPPFSVPAREILGYWPDLERVDEADELETGPPKFREAGLARLLEVVWRSATERKAREDEEP